MLRNSMMSGGSMQKKASTNYGGRRKRTRRHARQRQGMSRFGSVTMTGSMAHREESIIDNRQPGELFEERRRTGLFFEHVVSNVGEVRSHLQEDLVAREKEKERSTPKQRGGKGSSSVSPASPGYKAGKTKDAIDAIFDMIDKDNTGSVTLAEVVDFLDNHGALAGEDVAKIDAFAVGARKRQGVAKESVLRLDVNGCKSLLQLLGISEEDHPLVRVSV